MTYRIWAVSNGWVVQPDGGYHAPTEGIHENTTVFNEFKDAAKFLKDKLKLKENN